MFKKFTAICLTFILVISMAILPVFASYDQNITTVEDQASIVNNDKKDKKDKNDDYEDLLKDVVKKFLDSDEYSWAQKSIEKMGLMGILSGTGNGYFKPKSNVTHVEAIAMVLKLTGYKAEAESIKVEPKFFKGKSDPWSYGYLQLALDKGIIIPSEDGSFNPKTPAKRHEVAKYVVRALKERTEALKNMNAKLRYDDAASIPAGSRGYVYVITDMGIMQGSNNLFQPNKPITRAELAVILDKAEGKTDEPGDKTNKHQGSFVEYDERNLEITIEIDDKDVVYDVNKNAPVYKNNKYYKISSLDEGDVIRLILDNDKKVIFIEFIEEGTQEPTEDELTFTKVSYSNLPEAIQDKVDDLKEDKGYAAFKHDGDVYLIAARGEMPTGGYTIEIEEVVKQTVETDKFNLKVVVDITNPGSAIVTQSVTHPYSVVKINNLDDIEKFDKVKFVNESGTSLAQTTLKSVDEEEIISGTIYSVDDNDDEVVLTLSNNVRKTFEIPDDAEITLDGDEADLADIEKGMKAKITKINDEITELEATSIEETISGTIYAVDTSDDEVTLTLSNNVRKTYEIPDDAEITVDDDDDADLADLKVGMTAEITKINGDITELKAETVEEIINGTVYLIDTSDDEITLTLSNNVNKKFEIPAKAEIIVDGDDDANLSDVEKGMTAKITKINGVITELKVTTLKETIEGTVDSVNTRYDRVTLVLSNNVKKTFVIPDEAEIIVDGDDDADLSDVQEDMDAEITKINGVITKLVAED